MNEYQKRKRQLELDKCKHCMGMGSIDDAEPGDMYHNEFTCQECNGTGMQ